MCKSLFDFIDWDTAREYEELIHQLVKRQVHFSYSNECCGFANVSTLYKNVPDAKNLKAMQRVWSTVKVSSSFIVNFFTSKHKKESIWRFPLSHSETHKKHRHNRQDIF